MLGQKKPSAKLNATSKKMREARLIALNIGAEFTQTIASEIFKQTIVANAAGVAAILAYLSNKKVEDPFLLVCAAGCFLLGVALALMACLLTYTQATSLLKKMMGTFLTGKGFKPNLLLVIMGRMGIIFCWLGVLAFITGAVLAAIGLYEPLLLSSVKYLKANGAGLMVG